MNVAVCIPFWDSGCPHRNAALGYVTAWWYRHGFTVSLSEGDPHTPFNISEARNHGARFGAKCGADVLIFADADTIPQIEVVQQAIYEARICPGVIYPHDRYWSLIQADTAAVLDGTLICGQFGVFGKPNRVSVSGVVVCTVASWEAIGGWDEEFTGWGNEDTAFALMARDVLGRALRMRGHVWHLWHPRDVGYPTIKPQADADRIAAYRAAAIEGPHALRALRGLP